MAQWLSGGVIFQRGIAKAHIFVDGCIVGFEEGYSPPFSSLHLVA